MNTINHVRAIYCLSGLSLIFLLSICPFNRAQAQVTDSLNAKLDAVVIQATRIDANSPIPHTNITSAAIARRYQAQDIPYLISNVPSLVETSDAGTGTGYTSMRIRGSDPTRINVTLNGVPLNDAESQGMYWVDLPDLAASASEIQVQRGVGSSTNGAGAFGATVNIDLSKVSPTPFAVLNSTAGSFQTYKNTIYLGTGLLDGKWAFSGRLSKINSDGYIDRARVNLNSFHLTGVYVDEKQSFQVQLLSGHEITYQAWNGVPIQYINDRINRTYNSAGAERPGLPHPNEVDDYTQRHLLAHYKIALSPKVLLQINGHYTRGFGFYEQYKANQHIADYLPALPDSIDTDLIRRRWLSNHFGGTTWALKWNPNRHHAFTFGGAWNLYQGAHFGEVIWAQKTAVPTENNRYYDNDATKQDANIFVQHTITRGHWTTLSDLQVRVIDYRFLGFNNLQENITQQVRLPFFNPKIGATYTFKPEAQVYAYIGVAHREPNRDDYTQSTPESRPKAEQLLDLESGYRYTARRWSANANLFYMHYNNQLVVDGRINDVGAYIRTNVPDSYRAGIEAEAAFQPNAYWSMSGNLSWSKNKVRTFKEFRDVWDDGSQLEIIHQNTDLAFSPGLIARLETNIQCLPKNTRHGLACTLVGRFVGKQYLDNTSNQVAQLPTYSFADLRINYDLSGVIGEKISLVFSINNLTNAQYASNGWVYRFVSAGYNPVPDDPYARAEGSDRYQLSGLFPQAGRNWVLSIIARL